MSETRCDTCKDWQEQCHECEQKDHRSGKISCEKSNGSVPKNECGLKSVHAKRDECSKCGYSFDYE